VASIHMGLAMTIVVGCVALWRIRSVPRIPFTPSAP
jgi:hypothetical protein